MRSNFSRRTKLFRDSSLCDFQQFLNLVSYKCEVRGFTWLLTTRPD